MATEKDWQRLGDQFRAARRDAGYRKLIDFQRYLDEDAEAQITGRTYADIENGKLGKRRTFASESLAYLEDLFGWHPGVHRAILEGRRVDVFTGVDVAFAGGWQTDESELASGESELDRVAQAVDARLLSLEERVQNLERRLGTRTPQLKLSPGSGKSEAAIAAHQEGTPIAGEQGADETP